MRRIAVHRVDRRAHLFIRQCEQPSDSPSRPFRQMQPQRLNEQHMRKVLSDQDAARLWL